MKQWLYDWGYSNAYLEILCTDTTIYDYDRDGKSERKVTQSDMEKTMKRYKEQTGSEVVVRQIKLSDYNIG